MSQGEEDERYYQVAAVFKKFGQPNAQFPKDLDLGAPQDEQWRCQPSESSHSPFFHCAEYTELQKHVAAMGGLGTVLKNMKAKAPPPPSRFRSFRFLFRFYFIFFC